jgi:hypothetical protein
MKTKAAVIFLAFDKTSSIDDLKRQMESFTNYLTPRGFIQDGPFSYSAEILTNEDEKELLVLLPRMKKSGIFLGATGTIYWIRPNDADSLAHKMIKF